MTTDKRLNVTTTAYEGDSAFPGARGGGAVMSANAMACGEISADPIPGGIFSHGAWRCAAPAHVVELPTPAGRPAACAAYCDAHGGAERARREAEADWMYLAPAEVGDVVAVMTAGAMGLRTPDAYVVIRHEGRRWLAFLGVGSMLDAVPTGRPAQTCTWVDGVRIRGRLGAYACLSREEAVAIGVAAWRTRVDADVAAIWEARGGTLAWGRQVAPLPEPVLVDATARNAWEAATEQRRRAPTGRGVILGLRASGESI